MLLVVVVAFLCCLFYGYYFYYYFTGWTGSRCSFRKPFKLPLLQRLSSLLIGFFWDHPITSVRVSAVWRDKRACVHWHAEYFPEVAPAVWRCTGCFRFSFPWLSVPTPLFRSNYRYALLHAYDNCTIVTTNTGFIINQVIICCQIVFLFLVLVSTNIFHRLL